MPKYYCDYCDIYLTHDSPSVRKSHNDGWKHKQAVRNYYQQFEPDFTQQMIDQKIREFEGRGPMPPFLPPPFLPPGFPPGMPPRGFPPGMPPPFMPGPHGMPMFPPGFPPMMFPPGMPPPPHQPPQQQQPAQ